MTAPIASGFSIHERRKRTSSSISRRGFFGARADGCGNIWLTGGVLPRSQECHTVTRAERSRYGLGLRIAASEEVFDFGEESRRLRLRGAGRQALEFTEQF